MSWTRDKSTTLVNGTNYGFQNAICYQNCIGTLSANSHPGSYTGQDAYNDMLIVNSFDNQNTSMNIDKMQTLTKEYRYNNLPIMLYEEKITNVVYNGASITSPVNRQDPQNGDPCHTITGDSRNLLVQDAAGVDVYNQRITGDKTMTLTGVACDPHHVPCVISYPQYVVRRLTPLECERLQGFPDYWTLIDDYIDSNGKKQTASDSKRYQALGNSIALPSWKWVLKRISAQYETDPTMASLFDGIGGFPYLWEGINGKGTCLWSSEIEDFQNAVTKERIG